MKYPYLGINKTDNSMVYFTHFDESVCVYAGQNKTMFVGQKIGYTKSFEKKYELFDRFLVALEKAKTTEDFPERSIFGPRFDDMT